MLQDSQAATMEVEDQEGIQRQLREQVQTAVRVALLPVVAVQAGLMEHRKMPRPTPTERVA